MNMDNLIKKNSSLIRVPSIFKEKVDDWVETERKSNKKVTRQDCLKLLGERLPLMKK